jgi:hypothetical protein
MRPVTAIARIEAFAFGNGQRLATVVNVSNAQATERHDAGAHGLARSTPLGQVFEATT